MASVSGPPVLVRFSDVSHDLRTPMTWVEDVLLYAVASFMSDYLMRKVDRRSEQANKG